MRASVTQADVAREAGVSRTLVSMALAGSTRVAQDTREHILDVASRLGYARDLSAATLASASTSPMIGLLLPNLQNPYFDDFITYVDSIAESAGVLPLIATASNKPEREAEVMQRFRELRVRGLAVFSPASSRRKLSAFGDVLPLVVVGDGDIGGRVDAVRLDENTAATQVLDHLKSRGWGDVVYLSDVVGQGDRGLARRRQALVEAASEQGVSLEPVEISREGVDAAIADLVQVRDRRGSAFVCHNDLLTLEVISALRARGYGVGGDVAVVGYDDTHLSGAASGNFTSVGQQLERQAEMVVELINSRADFFDRESREFVFPPVLDVRASS